MSPYHWPDHLLLVSFMVRGRGSENGILVRGCTQDEVIEHIIEKFIPERDREIAYIRAESLTQESFNALLPLYEHVPGRYLEGD